MNGKCLVLRPAVASVRLLGVMVDVAELSNVVS